MVDQAESAILRSRYYGHLKPWWTKEFTHFSNYISVVKINSLPVRLLVSQGVTMHCTLNTTQQSEFAAMCKQASEEYEISEEKELRETQFVNHAYLWHMVNMSRKVGQAINDNKDRNCEILCKIGAMLDELVFQASGQL